MTTYICPVEIFAGELEIDDFLNYPQLAAYERSLLAAQKQLQSGDAIGFAELRLVMVPGLVSCVKAWRLKGLPSTITLETFPSTPKKEAGELYLWLLKTVRDHIEGDNSGPK